MRHIHTHMLGILAFSVLTVVVALYAYMRFTISSSIQTIVDRQTQAMNDSIKRERDQRLAATYRSMSAEWARLPALFIPADDTVAFIEAVEGLGDISGASIAISAIDADDLSAAPAGTIGSVKAHADVRGTWSSVMKTLILAEHMPYHDTIAKVSLDFIGEGAGKNPSRDWHASFDIRASTLVGAKVSPSTTN